MNGSDYLQTLAENILKLRKKMGLTQEGLAEKLNISFQAVSKWENAQTSPDIIMLPMLAQLFAVSIDTLFGRKPQTVCSVDWDDDDTIRGVIYKGRKILKECDDMSKFTLTIEGDVLNVEAGCNVNCGNVKGDVNAGDTVNCTNVVGSVNAGDGVNCGNVEGDVNAGDSVTCGNVGGSVNAGDSVTCEIAHGAVIAGDNVIYENKKT